jgi:hypothetical protein
MKNEKEGVMLSRSKHERKGQKRILAPSAPFDKLRVTLVLLWQTGDFLLLIKSHRLGVFCSNGF